VTDRIDRIRKILNDHGKLSVPVEDLTDDVSLYSVGLTSHSSVNVMLALEDEFDVEFPESLLKRPTFNSLGQLAEALDSIIVDD
jgi:acyl carrier protein